MTFIVFTLTFLVGSISSGLIKFADSQFPPVILVFLRATLSALFLLLFLRFTKVKIELGKDRKTMLIASALFAGNWLFFAIGIQYTSVIMGQLLFLLTSLIVAILGYILLKEKLEKVQIIGLIITLIGMAILIAGSLSVSDVLSFGKPLGNIIVGLGVLSWSLYIVVSRKISKIYSPQSIILLNFIGTAIISLSLLGFPIARQNFNSANITTLGYASLLSIVIFNSILFFGLNQWLIKHTSAFISSLTLYPLAVIAGIVGVIFFHERPTPNLIFGGLLVMSGVYIATAHKYTKKYFKI